MLCRSAVSSRRGIKGCCRRFGGEGGRSGETKRNPTVSPHKSAEEKVTLTTKLLATADRAVKAEDAAKAAKLLADDAEKWQTQMHKRFHSFKESVRAGATKLQKELLDFLKKYGLDAPDVSSEDTVRVDDF